LKSETKRVKHSTVDGVTNALMTIKRGGGGATIQLALDSDASVIAGLAEPLLSGASPLPHFEPVLSVNTEEGDRH
jgi:hypothetical protein